MGYNPPFAWWEKAALWIAAGAASHGVIPVIALVVWGLARAAEWVCRRLEDPRYVEGARRAAIRRQRREQRRAAETLRKT